MYRIFSGSALAIALVAGSLATANAQYYPGYYSLPPGSYSQSCTNMSIQGSVLSATCTASNGQQIYSSLDVNRCGGSNVVNNNGYLRCANNRYGYNNGYGYGRDRRHGDNDNDEDDDNDDNGGYNNGGYYDNGGYGNGGYGYGYDLPPGSYQQSCFNERMRGAILYATCTASNGAQRNTAINVNRCYSRGTSIRNINGRLRC